MENRTSVLVYFKLKSRLCRCYRKCGSLLFVWFFVFSIFATQRVQADLPDDYHQSPVFFEMFYEEYADTSNLNLLPQGKLHMKPFGIRDMKDFTWSSSDRSDLSWWLQVEYLQYLLPFIASTDENHRKFAKEWFEKWYVLHTEFQKPNPAAWDWMTTAIRSMVLVYFLKQEEIRTPGKDLLKDTLKRSIYDHQRLLGQKYNFDYNSNHGMWEAIGLVELTRLIPNPEYRDLGLSRLLSLVDRSVSDKGIHKEHSPGYHFIFLKWLLEYIEYLRSMKNLSWGGLVELDAVGKTMLEASYFMQDHHGNIPTIGDTDDIKVKRRFLVRETDKRDGVCFDEEAGYAIFKEGAPSKNRRYVVFNIQGKNPELPFHYHDDAMAVYFNCDGEVILGDQGKYDYSRTQSREYFVSFAAHNTIVPNSLVDPIRGTRSIRSAKRHVVQSKIDRKSNPDRIVLQASTPYPNGTVSREVIIPKDTLVLEVEDVIEGTSPITILWNLGPDVERVKTEETPVVPEKDFFQWHLITKKGREFSMSISVDKHMVKDGVTAELVKGRQKPMLGWYSPDYQQKVPSNVIVFDFETLGEARVFMRLVGVD